ncbi:CABYR protein, partial [Atlantisia rogersi]|nr:CABYR protein [Atlantisia rogersi]
VPHGLKTLLEGVTQAVMEKDPEDIAEFFASYFQELRTFRKETGSEELEENITECTGTFSGEPKQKDKCTDTEEDHLLEEPDIQYSSKSTQCSSVASSIAESTFPPGCGGASAPEESSFPSGWDGASAPEGRELVYVPAEPAQLAAHVLGNCNGFCTVRDVATNVQTLYEDSQTSENEFTSEESAAEHASAVPAAETTVQAAESQPGVWGQPPTAGELGHSACQADVSTNDINQASCVTLCEEPSPTPKDALQAMPSCKEAEVTSAAGSVCRDDRAMVDAEVP